MSSPKLIGLAIFVVMITNLLVLPISASAINSDKKTKKNGHSRASTAKKGRALIIYTGQANRYARGYRSAENIKFFLQHFHVKARTKAAHDYSRGDTRSYRWVFYVGQSRERVGRSLANDLSKTKKKVFWINNNIRQLKSDFFYRHGFKVSAKKKHGKQIYYKDTFLPKTGRELNDIRIIRPKRNITYSEVFVSKTKKTPHVINSRNFWYIADDPFGRSRTGASFLVFADLMHNMVKDHPYKRKALIRVDGVNPKTDPDKLRILVNFLYINQLPFAVSVTPVYKKSAGAKPIFLHDRQELLTVIKSARDKGGIIALNGYTHQDGKKTGSEGEFGFHGPRSAGTAKARTERRVKMAIAEMEKSGLAPKFWHTPLYQASPADYQVFRKYFRYDFERGSEPPTPYIVGNNLYGQKLAPENLGMKLAEKGPKSERVEEKAWQLRVVRDAYGGFSITPGTRLPDLARVINKMRTMGYDFVSPNQVVGLKSGPAAKPFVLDYALYQVSFQTNGIMSNLGWMLVPVIFFTYYLIMFGLSHRLKPRRKQMDPGLFFVFIVPALNEGKIIRQTLKRLAGLEQQQNYLVLAVNDNSSDNTEAEIREVKSDRIQLLNVRPPNCQQGKGNVLNIAYRYILNDSGLVQRYGLENIIIGVVDSDGGVDPDILPSVSPYFQDKRSGSVQTSVRIENCDRNIWTQWQDFDFRVFTSIFQSAREQLGSVGLGGNGQFIRLSALCAFGESPWTKCLTEDLDIGIRLLLNGWRNHFCSTSYVNQQAVPQLWPLIKQRTRWFQGHVQCWRHLGPLAVKQMPVLAKVDTSYYLLSISMIMIVVPANFVMATQVIYLITNPELFRLLSAAFGFKVFIYWYCFNYGAIPIFIYSYWRSKKQSLIKATVLSHLYLFISVIWLIAGYLAIFRLFRRTTNWAKTPRYLDPMEEETESV